eukprot:CAMPEP_0206153464 /NCGR_PEP_ID=MMETSP1474-20131121/654_1 /ASSEMBLY_ACC=CAM_ASM_001110 /TAXON_ID=97495 /ORGANISM="Imantonia sp., Strain RCC918" /LENGTH=99 /DNA_ID=CAMNT_0053551283 /DNA_START=33 /DNA_END=332 /DNA_ORIENTATION=+
MPGGTPPMYPVINGQPTPFAVFRNIGFGEWFSVVGWTVAGSVAGFVGGKPLRRQGSFFLGGMGALLGFLSVFQKSALRLHGYMPNEAECRSYGVQFAKA